MRKDAIRTVRNLPVIVDQIQIDKARGIAFGAHTSQPSFNLKQVLHQLCRVQSGLDGQNRIGVIQRVAALWPGRTAP